MTKVGQAPFAASSAVADAMERGRTGAWARRAAAATSAGSDDPDSLLAASRQLEGVFLNMVFEEMAKTVPENSLYGASPGMEMAQSWMRTELSGRWASAGGTGLGDSIAAAMGGPPVRALIDMEAGVARFPPPVDGVITSSFGPRDHPVTGEIDFHEGVDLAVPPGTPVRSPFPGRVVDVGEHPHLGRTVVVEHAGGYRSVFGHVDSPTVEVGDPVAIGAVVARSGQTGRTTGPHVHYGLIHNGRSVDPARWIPRLRTDGLSTTVDGNPSGKHDVGRLMSDESRKADNRRQVFDGVPDMDSGR